MLKRKIKRHVAWDRVALVAGFVAMYVFTIYAIQAGALIY